MTQTVDPSTLSFEELTRLANEELQTPTARDEHGRFVSQEPAVTPGVSAPVDTPEEVDEIVYRRVIDLGDGSGTQVFEAPTMEELVDKLSEAQTHATRKIRELSAARKEAAVEPEISADDEFVLSQRLLNSPTKAFDDLFKMRTGMTPEEFKAYTEKTKNVTQAQEDYNVGIQFAQSTPEWVATPKNISRMEKWLKVEGLQVTLENVQKAFADLTESGLLEAGPETQDAETTTTSAGAPRIAETTTRIVGQRRAASGISSQGSRPAVRAQGPTEDELYNMPLEKLAELANKAAQ